MPDERVETPDISVDLLVVGAGPTGLFAATYAGFRNLRVAVVDSLAEPGGQVSSMYPEKQIFYVAAFPAVKGRDLVDNLVAQAGRAEPTYLLQQEVTDLFYDDGLPVVATSAGTRIRCKALVLTVGIGSFSPRPLPAAASYEGHGRTAHRRRLRRGRDGRKQCCSGGRPRSLGLPRSLH